MKDSRRNLSYSRIAHNLDVHYILSRSNLKDKWKELDKQEAHPRDRVPDSYNVSSTSMLFLLREFLEMEKDSLLGKDRETADSWHLVPAPAVQTHEKTSVIQTAGV